LWIKRSIIRLKRGLNFRIIFGALTGIFSNNKESNNENGNYKNSKKY